jgi:hypothetical protein
MSPVLHNTVQESDTIQESSPVPPTSTASTEAQSVCPGGTCQTGVCSPCLFIWGGLAVWMIINALWERFQ